MIGDRVSDKTPGKQILFPIDICIEQVDSSENSFAKINNACS